MSYIQNRIIPSISKPFITLLAQPPSKSPYLLNNPTLVDANFQLSQTGPYFSLNCSPIAHLDGEYGLGHPDLQIPVNRRLSINPVIMPPCFLPDIYIAKYVKLNLPDSVVFSFDGPSRIGYGRSDYVPYWQNFETLLEDV